MKSGGAGVWRPYVVAAAVMSILFGFGLGGGLFAVMALGRSIELWWIAASQAHGHVQLFGWAGLMVLGVGFHFLPKLAGGSAANARYAHFVLLVLGSGIVLRVVLSVILAQWGTGTGAGTLRFFIALVSALELAGAVGAAITLGLAVGFPAPLRLPAASSIAPLAILAMVSLVISLVVNLAGAVDLVRSEGVVFSMRITELTQQVVQYGFLLPIAIAMSARLFPLYVRTPPVSLRKMLAITLAIASGLLMRGVGIARDLEELSAAAAVLLLATGLFAVWAVGVFGPRRPLPRKQVRIIAEPLQMHVVTAYAWLIVALVAAALFELDVTDLVDIGISATVERHAFGAGFVTILILGVGQVLLPGFDRSKMKSTAVFWSTLVLGNISVLFRVLPAAGWDAFGHAESLMALAGLMAIVAVLCFSWNIALLSIPAAIKQNIA